MLKTILLLGLSLGVTTLSAADSRLRAGAGKVDITPPINDEGVPQYLNGEPVWMAGYDLGRAATGFHDPLYARAFVLEAGSQRLALVSLDLVGFMWHDVLDARHLLPDSLGIDQLIVCSTHNHEGPDAVGLWGHFDLLYPFFHLGHDELYMEEIKLAIVESVRQSVRQLRPASLRPSRINTSAMDLIGDSRKPEIIDQALKVIQGVADDGSTIFTFVNWNSHPELLGPGNTLITADFPKWVCDEIEENIGGITVYTSGALGGLLSPKWPESTFEGAEEYGRKVGARALRALALQPRLLRRGTLHLLQNSEVDIFLFNPLYRLVNFMSEPYRREREFVKCGPLGRFCLDIRTEVDVVALDSELAGRVLEFASIPGEIVPELGYDIMNGMDGRLNILLGLANDELGYILPLNEYECDEDAPRDCWPTSRPDYRFPINFLNPKGHYEETVSVGPGIAESVLNAVAGLHAQLPKPAPASETFPVEVHDK